MTIHNRPSTIRFVTYCAASGSGLLLLLLLLVSRGGRWSGVRVRWEWCVPLVAREWMLWRKGIEIDLQWGQVAELWEPCQELSDLEGCRPHIPRGQIRGMGGAAEEVGYCVVGGAAIRADGAIGPSYGVTVGLEPRAMAGTDMGEGAAVYRVSSCSAGSIGGGGGMSTLLGAWHRMVSSIIRPRRRLPLPARPRRWGSSPLNSQASWGCGGMRQRQTSKVWTWQNYCDCLADHQSVFLSVLLAHSVKTIFKCFNS